MDSHSSAALYLQQVRRLERVIWGYLEAELRVGQLPDCLQYARKPGGIHAWMLVL